MPYNVYMLTTSINQTAYPTFVSNTNFTADITEWWLE